MKTLFLVLLLTKSLFVNFTEGSSVSSVNSVYDSESSLSENVYLGISDPISDTVLAYEQAVQRALAFYALSTNVYFSSVYEHYYLDAVVKDDYFAHNNTHWIADIDVNLDGISYKVEKKYRTRFNETVVLLDICDGDNHVDINVTGSFMYYYEYDGDKDIYGEKQLLTIESDASMNLLEWDSKMADNGSYLKQSVIDGEINVMKRYANIYDDYGHVDDGMVFCVNDYGLWNSLVDTFFQALSLFQSKNVVLKNTSRQIQQETDGVYEDKKQNIDRLVMRTNVSCSLTKFSLNNNVMYAVWEINEK